MSDKSMQFAVQRPMQVRERTSPSAFAMVPLYVVLAGTAGMCSPQSVARFADFSPTHRIQLVGRKSQNKYRTISESLIWLRDSLGLKMSEVAYLFGVSRTAAYDWLSGATPKAEVAARIELIANRVDSIRVPGGQTSTLRLLGRGLMQAMHSGQSIEEAVLAMNPDRISQVPFGVRRLGSGRSRSSGSDSFSEMITPVMLE